MAGVTEFWLNATCLRSEAIRLLIVPEIHETHARLRSTKRLCARHHALADDPAHGHRGGIAVTCQHFTPLVESRSLHGDRACQRPSGDDAGPR